MRFAGGNAIALLIGAERIVEAKVYRFSMLVKIQIRVTKVKRLILLVCIYDHYTKLQVENYGS